MEVGRQDLERDEQGQHPDLGDEADEEALVAFLRHPGPEEELDDEEGVGGDGEEVGLEGVEAEGLAGERDVG